MATPHYTKRLAMGWAATASWPGWCNSLPLSHWAMACVFGERGSKAMGTTGTLVSSGLLDHKLKPQAVALTATPAHKHQLTVREIWSEVMMLFLT